MQSPSFAISALLVIASLGGAKGLCLRFLPSLPVRTEQDLESVYPEGATVGGEHQCSLLHHSPDLCCAHGLLSPAQASEGREIKPFSFCNPLVGRIP